jgi:hypothetical protein
VVRDGGQGEGGGDPDDEQLAVAEVHPGLLEHQVDRPVVEVGGVADLADRLQRPDPEGPGDRPRLEGRDDEDRAEGGVRCGGALEEAGAVEGRRVPEDEEPGERQRTGDPGRGPAGRGPRGPLHRRRPPQVGEGDADQQLAGPGVGAVVGGVVVAVGPEAQVGEGEGAGAEDREDDRRQLGPGAAGERHDRQERDREEDVELLLDGQRPEVQDR